MAIIDRIGYYTVFEDGYIVKGKEWYPLVTKSDCSINMIPEPVQPDPTYVVTERNIWGRLLMNIRRVMMRKLFKNIV